MMEKGVGELRVLIFTEYDRWRGTVLYELPVFLHLRARCAKKRKKKGDPFFHKGQLIAGDVEWTGVG